MTNTTFYLEHYLDSLETLPSELKKNFNKMHDLDVKNKDIMVEIDSASDEYLRKVRDLSPGKRKAEMEKIQVCKHHYYISEIKPFKIQNKTSQFCIDPQQIFSAYQTFFIYGYKFATNSQSFVQMLKECFSRILTLFLYEKPTCKKKGNQN